MVRRCRTRHYRHPCDGARDDHSVDLMESVRDWFLDRYGLCARLDGKTRQVGASLDVCGDGDDVEGFAAQHLRGVGVESVHAVSFAEGPEPPFVTLRSGYELNAQTVMEDLCPRVRYVRAADVLVIVELTLNVKLRCRSLNVVDCVSAPFVDNGDIGEHPHPTETDDTCTIFLYGAILS